MNLLLLMCFVSNALLGMESDSEPLINAVSNDLVAIDINAPAFKENFREAVDRDDNIKMQECLEHISKKFIPNTHLDPLVAGYCKQYFSLREKIHKDFTDEYLQAIEPFKHPPIIQRLMKLTDMRLQRAAVDTLDIYDQEQLKEKRNEKKMLCCVGVTACLALSGFAAFATTVIISINNA